MQFAKIEDIHIAENRQRKEFDVAKLQELIGGILSKGLFHPIILRESEEGHLSLVAGERRLRAITEIHESGRLFTCNGTTVRPGEVPYLLLDDLTDLEMREAELEENILRVDLSWQERTAAESELHRLREASNPGQTQQQTAQELANASGVHLRTAEKSLATSLIVAEHLDDEEVAKAATAKQALKIVARNLESRFAGELHRREGVRQLDSGASPHTLIHGDLFTELPKLKDNTFSCIIADPPYGMEADKFGSAAELGHEYEDSKEVALDVCQTIISEGFRLAREEAALFLFCDIDNFTELRDMVAAAGWRALRTPIIWFKGNARGHMPWQECGPRRTHELIIFATRGRRKLRYTMPDVIHIPPVKELRWAAEKPSLLYAELIRHFAYAGERILDPCCGTGPALAAGYNTHTKVTGIEQNKQAYGLAAATLQNAHVRWTQMMGGLRG